MLGFSCENSLNFDFTKIVLSIFKLVDCKKDCQKQWKIQFNTQKMLLFVVYCERLSKLDLLGLREVAQLIGH